MLMTPHELPCRRLHTTPDGAPEECALPDWHCRLVHESSGRRRIPSVYGLHYVSMRSGLCQIAAAIGPSDMPVPDDDGYVIQLDRHPQLLPDRDTVTLWLADKVGDTWPLVRHVSRSALCQPGTWHLNGDCAEVDLTVAGF